MIKRILGSLTLLLLLTTARTSADTPKGPSQPGTPAPPTPALSTNAAPATTPPPPAIPAGPSLYNLTVNSLDGKPVNLSQYRGQVALVVNTASHGGYTRQYAELETLYKEYKDKGFVVLGFPSNDFGAQEPDTPQQIATFCATKFDVTFPLFEKVKTTGDGQSPVFQFLSTGHGVPKWNFHKYLVGKKGQVIQEFPSQVAPASKPIHDAINAALKS